MLSDAEQRRLAEIESSLQAEDPVFVQRFDAQPRPRRRRTLAASMALLMAVTVTAMALVVGSVPAPSSGSSPPARRSVCGPLAAAGSPRPVAARCRGRPRPRLASGRWCIPWDPETQALYRRKGAASFRLKPTQPTAHE
jgi:Protein of unknown function (DUF3040)